MIVLTVQNGDLMTTDIRKKNTRCCKGPGIHYQVGIIKGGGWGLYRIFLDPDAIKSRRKVKTLLAVYGSEQVAEAACLHMLELDVEKAKAVKKVHKHQGKMIKFSSVQSGGRR